MPYGLMYIASYLRKHGVDVRISNSLEYADIIGISSMFTVGKGVVNRLASLAKLSGAKVVVGGNYASTNAEELIKLPYIDHVVVGEGEQAMLDIVRGNGTTERIVKRPLLPIDDIPMPAYDLVNMEHYLSLEPNPYSMRPKTMCIISSRGCPNDCAYCSIKAVWGRSWRGRSPKLVVDEIEYLQRKYDVHEFSFLDDSMSIDKERLEGICEELIIRNLRIKWTTPNGIAHWTLSPKILNMMKLSGCYRITFGIESGSKRIRTYIGKPYSLEQAKSLLNHANKIGMWTITTNIIGLPYEDSVDLHNTLDYAIDCGTDFACFYPLIIHQATRVAEDKDKIKLTDLDAWQRYMYKRFLLSRLPGMLPRLIRKVKSWEDFKYMCRLMVLGFKILRRTSKKEGHMLYD